MWLICKDTLFSCCVLWGICVLWDYRMDTCGSDKDWLLCKNIMEVIIMHSTSVMWHDLNQLLTQTVSGCLTNWWNNSCQDYCVTRLCDPRRRPLKKYVFLTEMSQFIQLYRVVFSNSIRPRKKKASYLSTHAQKVCLPTYDWKPAGSVRHCANVGRTQQ